MLSLYPDGCIVPNIRTKHYRVTVRQTCPHTMVVHAEITITAQSADDVMRYVQTWLRIPQTAVTGATEVIA